MEVTVNHGAKDIVIQYRTVQTVLLPDEVDVSLRVQYEMDLYSPLLNNNPQ
jgi:hypothetical protein